MVARAGPATETFSRSTLCGEKFRAQENYPWEMETGAPTERYLCLTGLLTARSPLPAFPTRVTPTLKVLLKAIANVLSIFSQLGAISSRALWPYFLHEVDGFIVVVDLGIPMFSVVAVPLPNGLAR
jgi:hypothetical protein